MFQISVKSHHFKTPTFQIYLEMGKPFLDLISIIICEHIKMLCFKFHQNRPINEEFDCWGFKGPRGFQGTPISKIQKTPHTERWSLLIHHRRTTTHKYCSKLTGR